MTAEYHKIYIPFKDVFELGGQGVFKNLEREKGGKNLVVIPWDVIDELDKIKDKSQGAHDVMDHIQKNVCRADRKIKGPEASEGTFYHALEGLDIGIVKSQEFGREEDKRISVLESKLNKIFGMRPILLTNEPKYHIKFTGDDMLVEEPKFLKVGMDIINEGIISGSPELQTGLYENNNELPVETAASILGREEGLFMNQFVRFVDPANERHAYARVTGKLIKNKSGTRVVGVEKPRLVLLNRSEESKKIHVGEDYRTDVLGISPRDMEQYLALQYGLLNPDVSLFFLCGSQGSGKTLLSYVAAVDLVLHYEGEIRKRRGLISDKKGGFFKRIILYKPTEIMGGDRRDVGFLPGELYDKLEPHLESFEDSHNESELGACFPLLDMFRHPKFDTKFGAPRSETATNAKIRGGHLPPHTEVIKLKYSGFSRGISITDTLVLIDEAQNFTPYELKTLIQRMGEGSKCVVMGDPMQRDNPLCTTEINGLTSAIRHYLGKDYFALVSLGKNYRHQMSADADSWSVYQK